MPMIWLATDSGLFSLISAGETWEVRDSLLSGEDIQVVAHQPGHPEVMFAGTYGNGLWRSVTAGRNWTRCDGIPDQFIRAIAFSPSEPRVVYVGTEPANLYRSHDAGETWQDLQIRQLPESKGWSLPYSPRSGALRTLIIQPGNPELILGGVEQGGVLKSTDGGRRWSIVSGPTIPADVHWLSADPVNWEKIFAATGDGVSASMDGGNSWQLLWKDYTRAVLVHPASPNLVWAGPARDVGEGGSILLSQDGGSTWAEAHAGRAFPLPDMVEFFVIHESMLSWVFAVLSEGEVIFSRMDPMEWKPLEPKVGKVQFLEIMDETGGSVRSRSVERL